MEKIITARLTAEPMDEDTLAALAECVREDDPELASAYGEMLDGCRAHPAQFLFYTAWRITTRTDGAMVGDFCFKGLPADGCPEIGYGILDAYRGRGYATEMIRAACLWALAKDGVHAILAETAPENAASQRVLAKIGFVPTGACGEEGPRFRLETPLAPHADAALDAIGDACGKSGILVTERLILRKWAETDASSLFAYASDPAVGPAAGWPPHQSEEESLAVIRQVLCGTECYAICEKKNGKAIGSIELKLCGHTDMTEREDECELGYWLGKPFWGRGYVPEAVREILRHGFEDLGMAAVWCGYYDGNQKSKRVQEKVGFVYHHTCEDVPVPLLGEVRVGHTNVMTRAHWNALCAAADARG